MANIVLLTSDLACSSQVTGAAARAGASIQTAMSLNRLQEMLGAGEVHLVIVDLNSGTDIAAIAQQTRKLQPQAQLIAFGPHVHEARLKAAADAGCNLVMTRGQFYSQLDQTLRDGLPRSK
jgi:DNA-binding response OmpR family regulator